MSHADYLDALRHQRTVVLDSLEDQFERHDSWIDALQQSARTLSAPPSLPARVRGLATEYRDTSKRMHAEAILALSAIELRFQATLDRLQDTHERLLELASAESVRFEPPISPDLAALENEHKKLIGMATLQFDSAGPGQSGTSEGRQALHTEAKATRTPRKASVNARLIDLLSKTPEAAGWTAAKLAEELHCSPSRIVGTNAWKSMKLDREKGKAERASQKAADKRKK